GFGASTQEETQKFKTAAKARTRPSDASSMKPLFCPKSGARLLKKRKKLKGSHRHRLRRFRIGNKSPQLTKVFALEFLSDQEIPCTDSKGIEGETTIALHQHALRSFFHPKRGQLPRGLRITSSVHGDGPRRTIEPFTFRKLAHLHKQVQAIAFVLSRDPQARGKPARFMLLQALIG